MDSDNEYANTGKVPEMSGDDYIKRVEEQSQKTNPAFWNDKFASEAMLVYPAKPAVYTQHIPKLFEIQIAFIKKHLKLSDKADDQQDAITGSTGFDNVHASCGHSLKPKEQQQLSEQIIKLIEYVSSETTEEGTVGGALTEAAYNTLVSFYTPLTKKDVLKQCVPIIKSTIGNGKGNIAATTVTNIQTLIQYISMNAKSVMTDNAEDIYMIGVNGNMPQLILGLGQVAAKCSGKFTETCDKFMEIYGELDQAQRCQIGLFIQEISNTCPEKMINHVSIIAEDLEQMTKYYSSMAMKNLCKVDADKVYEHKSEIFELTTDDTMNYLGVDLLGAVGKGTKSIDTCKECINKICEIEQGGKCTQVFFIGQALKDIAAGSEEKKLLLKNDYQPQIEKMLKNSDQKLVEAITQLQDYVNDRNLENVEKKIDDLRTELMDYVNERMEDIKANYNKSVKTLPQPVDIEVKKSVMNTIFLKFECAQHKDENCEYPGHNAEEGEYFKTKTKEVNKWVKVASGVFSMGKSVLGGDVGGALGSLAESFQAARSDDAGAGHFKALMEEPFLTSAENDRLILQLREANYFNHFSFQSQFNGWVCYSCTPFNRKEEAAKEKKSCACNIF